MKKGTSINIGRENRKPAKIGLIAAPAVLATPVIPPAADRSSGQTSASVYDCLVGTSIWLMLNRTSSTRTASLRFGMRGTRIRRTFDGKCVTTIVLTKHIRVARREANTAEIPARRFAEKNMTPSLVEGMPNR